MIHSVDLYMQEKDITNYKRIFIIFIKFSSTSNSSRCESLVKESFHKNVKSLHTCIEDPYLLM